MIVLHVGEVNDEGIARSEKSENQFFLSFLNKEGYLMSSLKACSHVFRQGAPRGTCCSCVVTSKDPQGKYCAAHYTLKFNRASEAGATGSPVPSPLVSPGSPPPDPDSSEATRLQGELALVKAELAELQATRLMELEWRAAMLADLADLAASLQKLRGN